MLRAAWVIAVHELLRIVRDRAMLVFGLVLPVIIITLVGLTFGGQGKIELGLLDADGSPSSHALVERLQHTEGVTLRLYRSESTLRRDVRINDTNAALVLPKGFGADVAAGAARVELVIDPTSEVAFSVVSAVDGAVTQVGVTEGAVQIVADAGALSDAEARGRVDATAAGLTPVAVEDLKTIGREDNGGTFSYTAPSNLVLFVFINTFAVSAVLANDRKSGVIRRQMATPNTPSAILLGIGVSKLLFSLVQSLLIVGIGWAGFGVHWGDPVGVVALVVAFALLSTAAGLLVGAVASSADQAQSIGIPLAVATGMLGGCMWPLAVVPHAMQVAGHIAPHAWAMDAWQELIYDRAGVADILPNLAVLVGGALVVGVIAVHRLRRAVLG